MTAARSGADTAGHLLEDLAKLMLASVSEVVPPDAQLHLFNAQRELLLAMAAIIEHNTHRSVRHPRATPKAQRPRRKRPSRVNVD